MFVTMSKDILARENRALGNFTTRQVGFGTTGLLLALFVGFKGTTNLPMQQRIYLAVLAAMPFLIWGFVKIYGEPMEKILPIIIRDNYINPSKRLYHTELSCVKELEKQEMVEEKEEEKTDKKKKKKSKPKKEKNTVRPSKDPNLKAIK